MDLSQQKPKSSFWNRFLRLSRKKEKPLQRQTSDAGFVTLESSALEGIHKDVLFLNKTESCFPPSRHVQFAPTPTNDNKENRSRPILKHVAAETKLLNVTYVDGPKIRTPSLPRTSTKKALVDRKNAIAPLNVSGILQYHSLPRNPKTILRESNPPPTDLYRPDVEEQRFRRSARGLNPHRQSCYGVSNPSCIVQGKRVPPLSLGSDQDVERRFSLGPQMHGNDPTKGVHPRNVSGLYARSLDQPMQAPVMKAVESHRNRPNKKHLHASTGHIPNKAINEVGLPFKKGSATTTRSKSPHYIPLSETFSDKALNTQSKATGNHPLPSYCEQSEPPMNKKQHRMSQGPSVQRQEQLINETRKQAILSAMQAQKRKIVNKLCKYSSQQSDEGFSSMADDECSFDCSCSACVSKLSRSHRSRRLKQDNKYFFTIGPEIKEETERLPENCTLVGPVPTAQPHLADRPKTWYECDDTLCESPVQKDEMEKGTPRNKIVENIYENITHILNSATRKNLTPQDVRKLLSSPISTPLKKTRKGLFSEKGGKDFLGSPSRQILSPASDCFNDSLILLQEIFQKLSQECKELLRPDSACDPIASTSCSSRYGCAEHLKSVDLSDFGQMIGGLAQSIFSEAKSLKQSTSLPNLHRSSSLLQRVARSLKDLRDPQVGCEEPLGSRSTTPTTEHRGLSNSDLPAKKSPVISDSSKCSEGELQLLENVVRLGMGLAPKPVSSPTKAARYKSRDVLSGRGKLKLKIYYNASLVTVNVIKAAKLDWANSRELSAYVKVTLEPDASKRVHWRTNVQKNQRHPTFNQKLSFELLPGDEKKRLVFSVWHRDYAKQRSELIGCMSFSVRHVMDNSHDIDGWYRLLRERFGTQKHFAAHTSNNSCSSKKS